jgi:hypothetical protein
VVVVAAIVKHRCEGSAAEPVDLYFDPAMSEQCLAAISSIASTVMAWATLRLLYTILKNARAQTNGIKTTLKYSSCALSSFVASHTCPC